MSSLLLLLHTERLILSTLHLNVQETRNGMAEVEDSKVDLSQSEHSAMDASEQSMPTPKEEVIPTLMLPGVI